MTTRKTSGAPVGNQNAKKAKVWSDAIRKVIVQQKKLDELALALVTKALDGDMAALKEIGDRLEGKAVQAVEQTTEHSGQIQITEVRRTIVKP